MKKSYEFMNPKGERVLIELTKYENHGGRHEPPVVWYKNKFIDHILKTYWYVDVYVHDANDNCWNKYNPMITPGTWKINFDWILEATEENAKKLIAECVHLAGGETQNEDKHRQVSRDCHDDNCADDPDCCRIL